MLKKMIPAVGLAFVLLMATCPRLLATSQTSVKTALQESLPYEVVFAVCQELENADIGDADTLLDQYKNGELTITKIETGVYKYITPNGGFGLVLMDEL